MFASSQAGAACEEPLRHNGFECRRSVSDNGATWASETKKGTRTRTRKVVGRFGENWLAVRTDQEWSFLEGQLAVSLMGEPKCVTFHA